MKRIILLFVIFSIGIFVFFNLTKQKPIKENPKVLSSPITPYPTPINYLNIDFNNKTYSLYYTKITGKRVRLIPNFTQKKSSQTIIEENNCKQAINGGFYMQEFTPLGLFITNGEKLGSEIINSNLLTGFFYIDKNGNPNIDQDYDHESQTVLQAGPLILSGSPLTTTMDEETRRSIIIKNDQGILYSLSIVDKENIFLGPTLAELPLILFSNTFPFKVEKALNLDGGSASFYLGEDGFLISELQPVGSVICLD